MPFVGFLFCFCYIIVIRSSLIKWEYVRSANVRNCFGKQTLCGCNIGEAIVSFGIDDNCQNAYPHGIGCINHLNCSKPIDMTEDECVLVDISTQFNSNGSVFCPDNYFLQSLYWNGKRNNISDFDRMICCNFKSNNNVLVNYTDLYQNSWKDCVDNTNNVIWCDYTKSTYIVGLYREKENHNLLDIKYSYSQGIYYVNHPKDTTPSPIISSLKSNELDLSNISNNTFGSSNIFEKQSPTSTLLANLPSNIPSASPTYVPSKSTTLSPIIIAPQKASSTTKSTVQILIIAVSSVILIIILCLVILFIIRWYQNIILRLKHTIKSFNNQVDIDFIQENYSPSAAANIPNLLQENLQSMVNLESQPNSQVSSNKEGKTKGFTRKGDDVGDV